MSTVYRSITVAYSTVISCVIESYPAWYLVYSPVCKQDGTASILRCTELASLRYHTSTVNSLSCLDTVSRTVYCGNLHNRFTGTDTGRSGSRLFALEFSWALMELLLGLFQCLTAILMSRLYWSCSTALLDYWWSCTASVGFLMLYYCLVFLLQYVFCLIFISCLCTQCAV